MGATTFVYLIEILLNFVFILPVFLAILLVYRAFRSFYLFVPSHQDRKGFICALILFPASFLLTPSREMILTKAEQVAEEKFAGDQKSLINIYEFISRVR